MLNYSLIIFLHIGNNKICSLQCFSFRIYVYLIFEVNGLKG